MSRNDKLNDACTPGPTVPRMPAAMRLVQAPDQLVELADLLDLADDLTDDEASRGVDSGACIDCGEPNSGRAAGRCRDCHIEHLTAWSSCRECLRWIVRSEFARRPVHEQHAQGCSLRHTKQWAPRNQDENDALRAARGDWADNATNATNATKATTAATACACAPRTAAGATKATG